MNRPFPVVMLEFVVRATFPLVLGLDLTKERSLDPRNLLPIGIITTSGRLVM